MRRHFALLAVALLAIVTGSAACGGGGSSDPWPEGKTPAAEKGRELVLQTACSSCHSPDGAKSAGPTWKGLAGSKRELTDGSTVVADANYLAESITDRNAKVVKGYAPIMPAYDLPKADVDAIVAYIQQLSADQ